jgi:hypothetical protein
MPYIKKENRKKFEDKINNLSLDIENDGELNYCITLLVHKELIKRGVKYQNMNNLIGVLESAKQEFYRTVVAPYEDLKAIENGTVSALDRNIEDFLE